VTRWRAVAWCWSAVLLSAWGTAVWAAHPLPQPAVTSVAGAPAAAPGFLPQAFGTPTTPAGTLNVLVVLMHYSDQAPAADRSDDPAYFRSMLFGTANTDTDPYPFDSMRTYYARQSFGALDVDGRVVGWLEAPRSRSYYARKNGAQQNGAFGLGQGFTIDGALQGGANALVDAMLVVHSGTGAETTGDQLDIASHQLEDTFSLGDGSTWTVRYAHLPERFDWNRGVLGFAGTERNCPSGTGVFAHELGHILGLPDLNDARGSGGRGIGRFGLMGWGDSRREEVAEPAFCPDIAPVAFAPWSLAELAWVSSVPVTGNTCGLDLGRLDRGHPLIEVPLDDADASELYLVGMTPAGGDWTVYGQPGVAIMHVDTALADDPATFNGLQIGPRCEPSDERGRCRDAHYWVSWEQADARFDLERGVNLGEAADVWRDGDRFVPNAAPWSCAWDGTDCRTRIEVLSVTDTARVNIVRRPAQLPPEPRIQNLPPTQARTDVAYRYVPELNDTTDVAWRLLTAPPGMRIDSKRGVVTWTAPATAAEQRVEVRVAVSNCAGMDTQSWEITVQAASSGGCGAGPGGAGGLAAMFAGVWTWLVWRRPGRGKSATMDI